MTIKYVALLKRREGMSHEAFVAYYETRHAPLILSLLPGIQDYRRNYLRGESAFASPGAAPPDFDVMTEIVLADRTACDRFLARSAEPDIARKIAEDEENLFDRDCTRMYLVDERASPLPSAAADPALRALIDEREIMRGLARFARVLDSKDWNALGDVFAQDVAFDYGTGEERKGLAALRDNMTRFLDNCGPTQHLIGSVTVDLAGDRAVSRSYAQARHQRAGDAAGAVFDSNGEYVDCWERRPEGWRIVRRDANWQTHAGDPAILSAGSGDLG